MIAAKLERIWYADEPPPWLLRLPEFAFSAVVAGRRRRYVQGSRAVMRFETPVVVVGNLTVGGTGKTPVVIALVQALAARGLRCGVVTRGYGASASAGVSVIDAAGGGAPPDPTLHGDEPALIAGATGVPVAIAVDRVAATQVLVDRGLDVVVSDDGLQHYRLGRSLEIAVIDGARGLGNGHLLPAGPLREPIDRLREVDWIIMNGPPSARCVAQLGAAAPARDLLQLELRADAAVPLRAGPDGSVSQRALASFAAAPVHAVAGIGNPARFFATLRAAGLEVIEHPFADHHAFTAADLQFDSPGEILMTEKDGVKCARLAGVSGWQVPVRPLFEPQAWQRLLAQIETQARAPQAAPGH